MLLHFALINVGVINNKTIPATGTTTVLSWCFGWFVTFYFSLRSHPPRLSRACRVEFLVLWSQLLALAVGAGAFSRGYFGWTGGHDEDLFQSLSLKYIAMHEDVIPESVLAWWKVSVSQRFVGVGWWACEIIDPLCHQFPLLLLSYFGYTHPCLRGLLTEVNSWVIVAVALVGPAQRFFWDLSTCGTVVCDGPYHGYLKKVQPWEQMFWHTAPCMVACAAILFSSRYHKQQVAEKKTKKTKRSSSSDEGDRGYSVKKTILVVFAWGLIQTWLAFLQGGEVFSMSIFR